ncbi:MAG TPA: hypothetical protein VNT99_11500, partial [Methylomirabilota bacterium]|nr:hypothetical protein [Methylomirabilota bacterium]
MERVKAWFETVFSLAKATTLIGVLAVIGLLFWNVISRERGQRQITFDLDPKIEKFFFDRGVDSDLRAELLDETNSRIQGVKSFLADGLFKDVGFAPTGAAQPVSFKPFGIEITTSEIVALARLIVPPAPGFRVRAELMCEPNPCESARSADTKAGDSKQSDTLQLSGGERWKRLSLIVRVSGPERSERLVFTMSAKPAAMRRALRVAMQRSAEKLLEQAEPLMANLLYNNANATFSDEQRRYAMLAAGTSLLIKREPSAAETSPRKCLGEIVLGISFLRRQDFQNGFKMLEDLAAEYRRRFEGSGN